MKYLLVVGEASADLHASNLIKAIRALDEGAEFAYIGGDLMAEATGVSPLMHYRDLAFMGFLPVLRNLSTIRRAARLIGEAMASFAPDVVIPVDYAGFNLRYVLPRAKALGIPIAYYIAPKLWAWRRGRVRQLRRYVDLLLCILPFEEAFFARHGLSARYVGNPTADAIRAFERQCAAEALGRAAAPTAEEREQIALLSGSRRGELHHNLPEMLRAAAPLSPRYRLVLAGAPGLTAVDYAPYLRHYPEVELRFGDTYSIVSRSRAALVTSGTATLETALLGTPQIVCYRMGGQRWLRWAWERLFCVPYISLVNLILGKAAVPELIGGEVSAERLTPLLTALATDGAGRTAQLRDFAELRATLGEEPASARAASAIVRLVTDRRAAALTATASPNS